MQQRGCGWWCLPLALFLTKRGRSLAGRRASQHCRSTSSSPGHAAASQPATTSRRPTLGLGAVWRQTDGRWRGECPGPVPRLLPDVRNLPTISTATRGRQAGLPACCPVLRDWAAFASTWHCRGANTLALPKKKKQCADAGRGCANGPGAGTDAVLPSLSLSLCLGVVVRRCCESQASSREPCVDTACAEPVDPIHHVCRHFHMCCCCLMRSQPLRVHVGKWFWLLLTAVRTHIDRCRRSGAWGCCSVR